MNRLRLAPKYSVMDSGWLPLARPVLRPALRAGLCAMLAMLMACTPKFDWRTVQGSGAPYTVLLPAKPSSLTRTVNLGGIAASMTMTAAEVDDVSFAVGSAELADADQARAALIVMKDTMVRNIGGAVLKEKSMVDAGGLRIDLDAGPLKPGGKATVLHARFIARERRVYQVIVVGPEKKVQPEAVDTFLTSFKIE